MSSPKQSETYLRQLGESIIGRPPTQQAPAITENPEVGKAAWGLAIANEFTGYLCIAHAPVKKIYRVSYLMMVEPTAEHPLHLSFRPARAADLEKLWGANVAAKPVKIGEVAQGFYREKAKQGEKERPLMFGVGRVVCVFDDVEVCFVRSKWEGKK
ncbi:hypothetical protein BJX66DRAFT_341137 [Aspergillus keveii]|uniref:Uncharacterized protein n=1 Tax=Aspergillus keveii TaxID=714993 RepID=A0ABR4FW52_9EURO